MYNRICCCNCFGVLDYPFHALDSLVAILWLPHLPSTSHSTVNGWLSRIHPFIAAMSYSDMLKSATGTLVVHAARVRRMVIDR